RVERGRGQRVERDHVRGYVVAERAPGLGLAGRVLGLVDGERARTAAGLAAGPAAVVSAAAPRDEGRGAGADTGCSQKGSAAAEPRPGVLLPVGSRHLELTSGSSAPYFPPRLSWRCSSVAMAEGPPRNCNASPRPLYGTFVCRRRQRAQAPAPARCGQSPDRRRPARSRTRGP